MPLEGRLVGYPEKIFNVNFKQTAPQTSRERQDGRSDERCIDPTDAPKILKAGKFLKPDIPEGDIGTTCKPKETNDLVQLDFWGPIIYIKEQKKYVLVAVDACSHWPLAYICSSNNRKNVLNS